jgi:hypothetical protein
MEIVSTIPPYRTDVFGKCQKTYRAWDMFIPYMSQHSVYISRITLEWSDMDLDYSISFWDRERDIDLTRSEFFRTEYEFFEKSDTTFMAVPIVLMFSENVNHANILILQKCDGEIKAERFEPHGNSPSKYHMDEFDNILREMFPTLEVKFEQPSLQHYECFECPQYNYTYEDEGYCLAWTWVYLELRILNPAKTRTELISEFRLKFGSMGVYIRQYVDYVRSWDIKTMFDNLRALSYDKRMDKLPGNMRYVDDCNTKTAQSLKCPMDGCESFCRWNASIWLWALVMKVVHEKEKWGTVGKEPVSCIGMILRVGEIYHYFFTSSGMVVLYGTSDGRRMDQNRVEEFIETWVEIVETETYTIGFLFNVSNPTTAMTDTTTMTDMELQFPNQSYTIEDTKLIPKATSFKYPFIDEESQPFIGWRKTATILSTRELPPDDILMEDTWSDRLRDILSYISKNWFREFVVGLLMYTGEVRRYIYFNPKTKEWHSGEVTEFPIDDPFESIENVIGTWIKDMSVSKYNITFITTRFRLRTRQDWKDYDTFFKIEDQKDHDTFFKVEDLDQKELQDWKKELLLHINKELSRKIYIGHIVEEKPVTSGKPIFNFGFDDFNFGSSSNGSSFNGSSFNGFSSNGFSFGTPNRPTKKPKT